MTDQQPPSPDDDARRTAVRAAAVAGERVRNAVLDRAIALAFAVQQGATVADLAAAVDLSAEQVQVIVDRAEELAAGTRAARRRQGERLVDHARKKRDAAEQSLRAAIAFVAEIGGDAPTDG